MPSHMTPSPPTTPHMTPSPPNTPHMTPSPPNMENIEYCTLLPTIMENTDKIEYDYCIPSPPSMESI